ncbi:hypothetical protein D3C73_534830 [compost metagenome]
MNSILFFPAFKLTDSVLLAHISQFAVGGKDTCFIFCPLTYIDIVKLELCAPEYRRVEV